MFFRWKWIAAHYRGALQCSPPWCFTKTPQLPSNPSNIWAADCKAKVSIWRWQLLIRQLYFGLGFQLWEEHRLLWSDTGGRTFIPHSRRAKGGRGFDRTDAAPPLSGGRLPMDGWMELSQWPGATSRAVDGLRQGLWRSSIILATEQRRRGRVLQT